MTIPLAADSPLFQAFASLPDPRSSRNQIYPLIDMIGFAIIGILCAANDWITVAKWAKATQPWFQSIGLGFNGVPSHDTFSRFFRLVNPAAFETCFRDWMQMLVEKIEGVIAVDGKTIRNSADGFSSTKATHIVTAFAAENDVILGQLKTEEKSNEITAIPELLALFKLKGCIVTIDAMGCQTTIAKQIKEQKGDYVLGLKGNQGILHAEVANFFTQVQEHEAVEEANCQYVKTIEKDHGRIEEREVWVTSDIDWLDSAGKWSGLKSIICIRSTRHVKNKTTVENRFYISSLQESAERMGQIIRLHWGIEVKVHWHLDVSFNEDKSKIRSGHGPQNFSLLKRCVLNLVKADKTEEGSVTLKRRMAGWDENYRLRLLGVN